SPDARDGAQCATDECGRLCRGRACGLSDFARARGISCDLRCLPEPDLVHAPGARRRAQFDVAGPVANRPHTPALHAGNIDVQHVGPARDVGPAHLESRRVAARHDVRGPLRRRGDIVAAGGPARTGAPVADEPTADLRIISPSLGFCTIWPAHALVFWL